MTVGFYRSVLAIAAFLASLTLWVPANAQSLVGLWEGSVTEQSGKSYEISIAVHEGRWSGHFVYKYYPCGGNLALSFRNGAKHVFIMRPTFGGAECVNGTHFEMILQADDHVAFRERIDNSSAASGTLYRAEGALDLAPYEAQFLASVPPPTDVPDNSSIERLAGYYCQKTEKDSNSYESANDCGPFVDLNCVGNRRVVTQGQFEFVCDLIDRETTFSCDHEYGRITQCLCEGSLFWPVATPEECVN